MSFVADPRVDAYIDALPDWQQALCREIRELVHAADGEVTETVKRRVQPYFVLDGNICALLAAKDHVNVFLYDGAIVPDPRRGWRKLKNATWPPRGRRRGTISRSRTLRPIGTSDLASVSESADCLSGTVQGRLLLQELTTRNS